ncbi:phosphopantetheine-binding protein [Actinomadura sp. 1N219]|uniref:phosphopantetheine-binding protein n=1 Tax=Actinomadura sp. 1N219 TaxID=3375152 RepID=UPI003795B59F
MQNTSTTGPRGRVVGAIVTALAQTAGLAPDTIGEQSALFAELGLDSTTILGLLMALEEELEIEFDTDSLEQHHFETVGTLASFVVEQLAEQTPESVGG